MFTPIKKRILSIFSISIITLALLYSAVASAVQFSPKVELGGNIQNKPGWVFKNEGKRPIKVQIPEPRGAAVAPPPPSTVAPQPVATLVVAEDPPPVKVTVIIYIDGRVELQQVYPLDTFTLPPGATAQVILAETMGPEVTALWEGVEFNPARGLTNLLPVPRTLETLFEGTDTEPFLPPQRVDPSLGLAEEGGLRALTQEERLLEQLKRIQMEREQGVRAPFDEQIAEAARKSKETKKALEQAEAEARQAAQEEYGRQAQEVATREEELTRQEQEAVVAQQQEPAMRGCLEGFFKANEQFEAAKKMQVQEMLRLCRIGVTASSQLKQTREDLAKTKKAKEEAESARDAAIAKAEREAAAAKSKLEREAAIVQAHIEHALAAALEVARRGATPLGTPVVQRVSEAPQVSQESPIKAAASTVPPSTPRSLKESGRSKSSILSTVVGAFDFSGAILGNKNETKRDGDGGDGKDHGGMISALGSSTSVPYSSTL